MKFRWDKKYLYWGVTAFCVIAASCVFFIALNKLDMLIAGVGSVLAVLTPVAYGFAFAYLVAPVATFFEKKCFRALLIKIDAHKQKRRAEKDADYVVTDNILRIKRTARTLSVLITVLLELLLVAGIIWAIVPQLAETVRTLVNNIPEYLNGANDLISGLLKDFPDIQQSVSTFISDISTNFTKWLQTNILPQMSDIVGTVSNGIMGTLAAFYNVVFGFIISIYFLHSKELFAAQGKKILYSLVSPRRGNRYLRNLRHVHKTFGGFITGKLLDSIIVGVIFFIIFTVFNFPYALLMSVILGVFNIIPYFGPIIGAVPCALLVLMVDPIYCLYFVIVVIIVQQLDGNVISPKIIGNSIGLSSFWVIFAILLGQSAFGFVGLIIGIPLFAVLYSFVRGKVMARLEKKGLPTDSNDYRQVAYISSEDNEIVTLREIKANEQKEQERLEAERRAKKKKKNNVITREADKAKEKAGEFYEKLLEKNRENKENKDNKGGKGKTSGSVNKGKKPSGGKKK